MNTVIVIVDDDEGHSILIRQNLEAAGLKNPFLMFRNGQAALDFFQTAEAGAAGKTYLMLLDIRMPKVSGIEVLRQLKADPEWRKLPIMMLTTTDDAREVEHCHELGCNAYLQKPIDYDRFAELVQTLGDFLALLQVPTFRRA
jgi:CheY-like chemotaxis protein